MQVKRFCELKNGDKVLMFDVKCVVSDIRVIGTVTGSLLHGGRIGDALYRFQADRVPDDDRKNYYNFSSGIYTAAASRTITVLD